MNNSIRNRKIYYLMNQIIEKISIVGIKIKYHPNDRENNQQLRYWQWTSNAFLSFYLPHRSEQIFFFNTLEKISNTINSSSCSEELYWDMSFANWFVLSWLTLKSRGDFFWWFAKTDHENRDSDPSVWSYYSFKKN
jgi:hypothetical protein